LTYVYFIAVNDKYSIIVISITCLLWYTAQKNVISPFLRKYYSTKAISIWIIYALSL